MKRWLVAISVTLALILLAGSLYLFDANTRAQTFASADRMLATRAKLIADTIDRTLQWRMSETFTFSALPSLRGFAASDEAARPARAAVALNELKAIVAADPNVRAASIIDPTGTVILTTDHSMNANWSERVFVAEAMAGHLYASPPARDFGEVSQYYSAPILDNSGNVAAALVLRVAVQELWGAFATPPAAMLVDEYGVRLVDRSDAPKTFSALVPLTSDAYTKILSVRLYGAETMQIPATNLTTLADAIKPGKAATLSYRDEKGTTMRAAIQRILTFPWTVVVYENEDTLLSPARDALWSAMGLSASALFAGALVWMALRGLGSEN
jgi:C4-dicarboxylate-specific signal transduction histidine kinase